MENRSNKIQEVFEKQVDGLAGNPPSSKNNAKFVEYAADEQSNVSANFQFGFV